MNSSNEFFDDLNACPLKEMKKIASAPWKMVKAKDKFVKIKKNEIKGKVHESVVIKGKVKIDRGTKIDAFCVIEGPVIIGKNCEIRSCAWIRPKTVIGNNVVIGHGCEIKNSLIFNDAKIGTNCFVGDSVLGKGARVGSGTILTNRRFDQERIFVKICGNKIPTNTDKFGAVIGEYSRLGANVVTNPATLIGKHSWVCGGIALGGFIPANKLIKVKQELILEDKKSVQLKSFDEKGKR